MVTVHAIPMKIQTVFPAAKKDITTVDTLVTVLAILMKTQTVLPAAKKDITTVNNLVTVLAILMKILTVLQLQAAQKDLVIGLMIPVDVAVQKIIL